MEIDLDELAEWWTLNPPPEINKPEAVLEAMNLVRMAQQLFIFYKIRAELES